MLIQSVKLQNYGIHGDYSIRFRGTSVAIVGENYSGKSTIIRGGEDAVFGSFRHKKKEECITRGKKTGSISTDFSMPGQPGEFRVWRSLNKSEAKLWHFRDGIPENENDVPVFISGVSEVGAWVDENIGSAKVAATFCFPTQFEISNLLQMTPGERAAQGRRVFGLESIEIAEKKIVAFTSSLVDPDIAGAEMSVEERKEDLDGAKARLKELVAGGVSICNEISDVCGSDDWTEASVMGSISRMNREIGSLESLLSRLESAKSAAPKAELPSYGNVRGNVRKIREEILSVIEDKRFARGPVRKLVSSESANLMTMAADEFHSSGSRRISPGRLRSKIDGLRRLRRQLDSSVGRMESGLGKWKSVAEIRNHISGLEEDLSETENGIEEVSRKREDDEAELSRVSDRIREAKRWIDANEKGFCPHCGAKSKAGKEDIREKRDELSDLEEKASELETKIENAKLEVTAKASLVRSAKARIAEANRMADSVEMLSCEVTRLEDEICDEISEITGAPSEGDAGGCADTIILFCEEIERVFSRVSGLAEDIRRVKISRRRVLSVSVAKSDPALMSEVQAMGGERAIRESLSAITRKSASLCDLIENYRESVREITGAEADEKSAAEKLSEARKRLSDAKKEEIRVRVARQARDILHSNGAPRVYIRSRMEGLVTIAAKYLSMFGVDFGISGEDSLSFVLTRGDERYSPKDLSGAETVILSTAIRLAASDLLMKTCRTMGMDEPTTWLHSKSIAGMASVLENMRRVGMEKGIRYITITHEERLAGCFDEVHELKRKAK